MHHANPVPFARQSLRATLLPAALLGICLLPATSYAYRPFNGTDADVADRGSYQLEFGPLGYEKHEHSRTLMGPAIVNNFGLPGDFEVVIEGRLERDLGESEGYRSRFADTGISVKHLIRKGALQGEAGVSVAMECSVLLPEIRGDRGRGTACGGAVSQQFDAATVHWNAAMSRNRDDSSSRFMGIIIEGRSEGVRPVMELFTEGTTRGVGRENSILVGAIWQHGEDLGFDAGIRRARHKGDNVTEFRAGLTWVLNLHKP